MNCNVLKEMIENNNIDEAISIVDKLGEQKCEESVPFLIKHLESTNSHILRNAIAIALSEIGNSQAVEPIINMLKNPKTLGYRGSLLYALQPFDCSAYIELLVDFLYEGNFEVSRNSFMLIESITKDISAEVHLKCILKIRKEIENLEEKTEFLSEALNVLFDLHLNNI